MFVEIILMIVFSRIKIGKRDNLRHDLSIKSPGAVELAFIVLGKILLLRIVIEDCRSVLRPGIIPLSV